MLKKVLHILIVLLIAAAPVYCQYSSESIDLDIAGAGLDQVAVGEALGHHNKVIDPLATKAGRKGSVGARFIERGSHKGLFQRVF